MSLPEQYKGPYTSIENLLALRREGCVLNLAAHKKALAAMAGGHRSPFKGRGIDFDEVRIYQPGDELRSIDWRVTARTGTPHTKLFHEERERPVYILLDQKSSMFFGSQVTFKSVVAAQTAAWLAWAGMANHDRIGGIVYADTRHQEYRPKGGKRGVLQLMQGIEKFNVSLSRKSLLENEQAQTANALEDALHTLNRVIRPGSFVFIISDFYGINENIEQSLAKISRHNNIMALLVSDPLEQQAPPPGQYTFSNGEKLFTMNTAAKSTRKAYQALFDTRRDMIASFLNPISIPVLELSTHTNYLEILRASFGNSKAGRQHR